MDFDLRLKALSKLAESTTPTAADALKEEFNRIAAVLGSESRYEVLDHALQLLGAFAYRVSAEATSTLLGFIHEVENRQLTYGDHAATWVKEIAKYQNAFTLMTKALEVVLTLRYLQPKRILQALLDLSTHGEEDVRSTALSGLKSIARYDLRVFYGDGNQPGIGARPQEIVMAELEGLNDDQLVRHFSGIETVAGALLSPTMQGTSWTYKSMTLSTGTTPAISTVASVRSRTIRLLKRVYLLARTVSEKLTVIAVLNEATRPSHIGQANQATRDMVASNTLELLAFYGELVLSEPLQIVQKVEHNAYWIFFHASNNDVEKAALAVRERIGMHAEYQIYKALIGFEGIFHEWDKVGSAREDFEATDRLRDKKASEFAASINDASYQEWRARILEYAKTQSDDLATFPVFYRFLERFAVGRPELAQRLVVEDTEGISSFLIPLLRGLWSGPKQAEIRRTLEGWLNAGRYLQQLVRLFLDNPKLDQELLRFALEKSVGLGDQWAVASLISVAVSNYARDKEFLRNHLFFPALDFLTEKRNTRWINDFWFRREARPLIADLDAAGVERLLKNLLLLDEVDFHSEEILYLVAQKAPEKVLTFFLERLRHDSNKRPDFDAVPFSFYKLHEPLSKAPEAAVRAVTTQYDGDYGMLIYRGAHLLKSIFPTFSPAFEAELLKLVSEGGDRNLEVVLAVLRNYEGQPFTHKTAKAVVRAASTNRKYLSEVEVALQSTGVVSGEYGFVTAYEAKKQEMKDWLGDSDEPIRSFAQMYVAHLDELIEAERNRAAEEIALRKHKYGE